MEIVLIFFLVFVAVEIIFAVATVRWKELKLASKRKDKNTLIGKVMAFNRLGIGIAYIIAMIDIFYLGFAWLFTSLGNLFS